MCGGMNISAIFDFHRFMRRLYEAPKLALDIIFRHTDVVKHIDCRVFFVRVVLIRGVRLEPPPAELPVACLKTRQGMFLALIEPKIPPSAEYASRAKPLSTRHRRERGF